MTIYELLQKEKRHHARTINMLNVIQNIDATIKRVSDNDTIWFEKVKDIYAIFDMLDSIVDLDYKMSHYYTDGEDLRISYTVRLPEYSFDLALICGDLASSVAILTENNCKYLTKTITHPATEETFETRAALVCDM
jgi:hypothetical protein